MMVGTRGSGGAGAGEAMLFWCGCRPAPVPLVALPCPCSSFACPAADSCTTMASEAAAQGCRMHG